MVFSHLPGCGRVSLGRLSQRTDFSTTSNSHTAVSFPLHSTKIHHGDLRAGRWELDELCCGADGRGWGELCRKGRRWRLVLVRASAMNGASNSTTTCLSALHPGIWGWLLVEAITLEQKYQPALTLPPVPQVSCVYSLKYHLLLANNS